ncbi:MAG: hypothetical protein AAB270_02785 [Chloroflexota bacterium]
MPSRTGAWAGAQLTQWLNLMRGRRLTVSIQGTTLRLLLADGQQVLNWVNLPFNPALLHNGLIANPTAMAQVIHNALTTKGLPPAPTTAAFPGFQSLCRTLHLPRASDVNPAEVVPREARRLMGFSERQHYLIWKPAGASEGQTRFVAVVVPRAPLQVFIDTLRMAGLPLMRMELAPLTLLKAANQTDAIVACVESNSMDIVIAVNSLPAVVRSLFLAEEFLTHESAPGRLAEELVRTLSFYNDANPENPLGPQLPIYVAGAFAGEELSAVVARETGHPVMEIAPRLKVPDGFPTPAMVVNMGLAVRQ